MRNVIVSLLLIGAMFLIAAEPQNADAVHYIRNLAILKCSGLLLIVFTLYLIDKWNKKGMI